MSGRSGAAALIGNIVKVTMSRGLSLLASVAIGFIIPKALGVTGYGFFKIFSLYSSYMILLHFGFIDGILVHFAGKSEQDLDRKEVRSYTVYFIAFQGLLALLLMAVCAVVLETEYRFIGIMLGINMFLLNLTAYFQAFSQAIERFNELSFRNVLSAVLKLSGALGVLLLYYFGGTAVSYRLYIGVVNGIALVLLVWYLFTYREYIFGALYPWQRVFSVMKKLFATGLAITVATQTAHLVLMMDRQFVSVLFDTDIYAVYAFAYSIVAVFTALISESAKVIFPMLKRMDPSAAIRYFSKTMSIVTVVSAAALVGFYPLCWFVEWFLPEYTGALLYLEVVLPALIPCSCISIAMFTFYKVLDKTRVYLLAGTGALVLGIAANTAAHFLSDQPVAFSWASVLVALVWYLLSILYFVFKHRVSWEMNLLYILCVSGVFWGLNHVLSVGWLAGCAYAVVFAVLTLLYLFGMKKQKSGSTNN